MTFAIGLSGSAEADAAPFTLRFDGVLHSQPGYPLPNLLDTGTFQLVATFDTAWPENTGQTDPAVQGVYLGAIIAGAFSVNTPTASYQWTIDPAEPFTNEILVANNALRGSDGHTDAYFIGPGLSGPSVPGLGEPLYVLLQLWDDTATALSSIAIPATLKATKFKSNEPPDDFSGD